MVSVSSVLPALTGKMGKFNKLGKNAGAGALVTALLCIPDFLSVPDAFKLKYDTDGEKVEGTNWESGLKELGKSAIKCAGYLVVPAAIAGLAAGGGAVVATLAGAAAFGSAFWLSSVFEEVLPEERELVAEACARKGITMDAIA